jgi:hypothetical protein
MILNENPYADRRYVIFDCTELPDIDFSEVYETSIDTVRKSVDQSQTFVKFDLPMPTSISALTTKSQPYTHEQILDILATPAWSSPMPIIGGQQ